MDDRTCARKSSLPVTANIGRREFVTGLGVATGGLLLPSLAAGAAPLDLDPSSTLFTLGVGSGDPGANSAILWTRLAPDPLNGGGMPPVPVPVEWEVARDPTMTEVIRSGTTLAHPEAGHSVHVRASGLPSDSWLWYRFHAAGEASPVGRTRTFPRAGAEPDGLRFALVSCQDYQAGFYAAYRDIVEQDLDFVVHVGDYIYEGGPTGNPNAPRLHDGPEIVGVEDYRNRYALYKLDPDLQAAHAAYPFIVTWDDHEVDNNYAGDIPEDDQTTEAFLQRRANAYQVYYETMPLDPQYRPHGPDMRLYRGFDFGNLARLNVLDTRQFRTDQPCGDGLQFIAACEDEVFDPEATTLGALQEAWLQRRLRQSKATWNVMAQQIMMMQWDLGVLAGAEGFVNMDAWDGYRAARGRILDFLAAEQPANPVVLTGDIHSAWAAELKQDFDDPTSATVGSEFVCTSISSNFGDENDALVRPTLPSNPHIKHFNGLYRGYALCDVNPLRWRTDFRSVADPLDAASEVFTLTSYGVQEGIPGVVEGDGLIG